MATTPNPDTPETTRSAWLTPAQARVVLDVGAAMFVVLGVLMLNLAAWRVGTTAFMFLAGVQSIGVGLFLGYDHGRNRE